ncbi:hypothetical protein BDZ89DRAFT_1171481 [Hymenopellis radicata]|nr:hypothetical protein BDZ89DRAFT_1171481 [Hymenopellis radicata]
MFYSLVLPVAFTVLLYAVLVLSGRILRRYLLSVQTGMNDLPSLGVARTTKLPGTAVVCGGSIAGLLTARACHDHFERVVIVEPEEWLSTAEGTTVNSWTQSQTRSRLIQYQSLHASMAFLYTGLKRLFPNLDQECQVSSINVGAADFSVSFQGRYAKVPYDQYCGTLPKTLYASRQALETLIRRLTFDTTVLPNIQQIVGTVIGVTQDPSSPGYVRQVSIRTKDEGVCVIDAALVIDCTGPTQAGFKHLQRAGFADKMSLERLKVTFDPKMAYSTIRFVVTTSLAKRLPIPGGFDNLGGCLLVLHSDLTKDPNFFSCIKQEANSVFMCCGAWGAGHLPVNLSGIREHVQSMRLLQPLPPWFWDFLDMMSEVEDSITCATVHVPPSFWTHYEKTSNLPANWIALGDSVCRFNPIFGQGCPKALLGVLTMNSLLYEVSPVDQTVSRGPVIPDNFSHRFFKAQAPKIKVVWDSAKVMDYGMATTIPAAGETLAVGSINRWLIRHMQLLSLTDEATGSVLWHSQMMLNSVPVDALHPVLVAKVLWVAVKRYYRVVCSPA